MTKGTSSRSGLYVAAVLTALYWAWESRAAGNIRVDLLLIYPVLLVAYLVCLWPKFKYWSILITSALMASNFAFFVNSYWLFHKNRG